MSLIRFLSSFGFLVLLLLVSCDRPVSKPDFDTPPDPAKYRKYVEDAPGKEDVSTSFDHEKGAYIHRNKESGELHTGWYKSTRGDGAAQLSRVVDGLEQGVSITWYGDATPMDSGWMLDGKRHGAYTFWTHERKPIHKRYEHGEIIGK